MTERQAGAEEVPPGYKQTEAGVIPEDWELKMLPEVCWFQEGPGLRQWQFKTSGMKVINVTNLENGVLNLDNTDRHIALSEFNRVYQHFSIDSGDMVIASSGNSYGKTAVVRDQDLPLMMNTSVIRIKPVGKIIYGYLWTFLNSSLFKDQIDLMITGGAQPNFGPYHLKQVLLPFPLPQEQRAIAAALSDADGLIGALDALIEKKRAIKQATMQQLLTGKKRLPGFEGEWETKQLCEIADIDPENLPSNTDPTYSFNYISLEQVDNGHLIGYSEEVFSAAPSRARRVLRYGDVLMSTVRPNLMAHLHYREQIRNAVCSTGFSVLRVKHGLADSDFLFAHLFDSFVNKQIEKMLAGSNYPAISSRDVKLIEITCPPLLPEQRAIAAILSDMDAEITAIERRREKAQQIKQGMMQQLLTGKVRLVESGCKGAQPYAE